MNKRSYRKSTKKYRKKAIAKKAVDKRQDRRLNKLSKLLKNELKFIVSEGIKTPTATYVGNVHLLSGVETGDTNITREGNTIRGATLVINYNVRFLSGANLWDPANPSDMFMRVIVFKDSSPNGVLPVMVEAGTGLGILDPGTAVPLDIQLRNYDNLTSGRYKILHDKVHRWIGTDSTQNNGDFRLVNLKFNIRHNINYVLDTAVIGACSKNHYFIACVIGAVGATYQPSITYSSQLRFWDP